MIRGLLLAIALYLLCGGLLILQHPGLQYDEALQVLGAVHMQSSREELTLPHDPDTWLCAAGRCLPLMMVRYAGALKDYLCLPLFAIFGARAELYRLVSMLLGAVGIFGVGWLLARHVAPAVGVAAALIVAIHPAYVDLTVFDNGTVAVWMASLGLTALAISRYLSKPDATGAFLIGAALGFGVWCRANYVWMIGALALAAIVVLRAQFLRPWREFAAATVGALAGASPFLLYQYISRGGTFEALGMFQVSTSFGTLLVQRLRMLAEVMISDREHRAMWNGPALPTWEIALAGLVVTTACVACLAMRSRWSRAVALSFLGLGFAMFSSRMPVAEHHLIALVPLAAAMIAIAAHRFLDRRAALACAAIYAVTALYWQAAAIRGLAATGGVGQWSDGVYELNERLRTQYPGKQIQFLDWGLQNNLYVLSDGQLRSREVYYDATREKNRHGRPWSEDVLRGGVYVMNGAGHRHYPESTDGFLAALESLQPAYKRVAIRQPNGDSYAEILDVEPTLKFDFSIADPDAVHQIDGFYDAEEHRWRWARRSFAVTFGWLGQGSSARLKLAVYVPPATIEKFGRITLFARLKDADLPPGTYTQSGEQVYERVIDGARLARGPVRMQFSVDKAFAPTAEDDRERGIIVLRASLQAQPQR